MNQKILAALDEETRALAERARAGLFHLPSPLGGRSALGFDGKLLLAPAFEAEPGEELELLAPGGGPVRARVRGFDEGRALAVLELAEALPATAFQIAPGLPRLGGILLAAAFPSPQGPEARLDLVRFAGGEGEEAYIQTDGPSFPGFSGGALLDSEGRLAGFIMADRPGNRGWAIPAELARSYLDEIAAGGSARGAYLGLSTLAVPVPAGLSAAFGDGREAALLVLGLQEASAADKAGILPGDFLLAVGGRATAGPEELAEALGAAKPGEALSVAVLRGGARLEFEAKPEPRPGRQARMAQGPGSHRGRGLNRGPIWRRGWAAGRWAGCGPCG